MTLTEYVVRLPELVMVIDLLNGHVALVPRRLADTRPPVRLTLAEVEQALLRAMETKAGERKEA